MLKKRISLLLILTLMVSALSILSVPQTACAKGSYKPVLYSEKAKTVHIDLTGDNKKETVVFKPGNYNKYGDFRKITIYINNKKVRTFKTSETNSYGYRFITIKGKTFLYLCYAMPHKYQDTHQLFQYKNKKLVRVITLDKAGLSAQQDGIDGFTVNGNELYVTKRGELTLSLYPFIYRVVYTYNNGHFKLKSRIYNVLAYNCDMSKKKITNLHVVKKFKIYSSNTCKKQIGTVPVGTVVKMTKVYSTKDFTKNSEWGTSKKGYASYYVTGGGYSGWICSKNIEYASLFKECNASGEGE